jgi:hypothetical protein
VGTNRKLKIKKLNVIKKVFFGFNNSCYRQQL